MENYTKDFGDDDDGLTQAVPREPEAWRWGRCQRCLKLDIDLQVCVECSRLVCQETCWPNINGLCATCIDGWSTERDGPKPKYSWE